MRSPTFMAVKVLRSWRSSEKVTGRLAVEVDLGDATMAYASYTRGFKPGGSI